jgi:MinD-like ATPase involved in chromosome partitioning or flagellar assembly
MIFSFYSYKGGVGRTQLLANVAAYLCYYKSAKVLIVDWDMEAPGCHYFFGKKNEDIQKDGILETFQEYCRLVREKGNTLKPEERPYFTREKNVANLTQSADGEGRVDLIPAGNYSKQLDFFTEAIAFNWYEFHEILDGKGYLEYIKKQLKNSEIGFDYDYIFIDSRTGINEYTNICNIQMSECSVLVIAPTEQNFEGSLLIAKRIQESPYVKAGKYRKPLILPILSRIDMEAEKANYWLIKFADTFSYLLANLSAYPIENILDIFDKEYRPKTQLSHNRRTAVGENILFSDKKEVISSGTLEKNVINILEYLVNIAKNGEIKFETYYSNPSIDYSTIDRFKSSLRRLAISANGVNSIYKELYPILEMNNEWSSKYLLTMSLFHRKERLKNRGLLDIIEVDEEYSKIIISLLDIINSLRKEDFLFIKESIKNRDLKKD